MTAVNHICDPPPRNESQCARWPFSCFFYFFSESKFYAIYNGENHFQIRGLLWPSYMFLNMVVRHSALLRKLALNVEDFYVKNNRVGLKNHVFDHETRKSGLFPCYRLKINDFLRSYIQNLKIDLFIPLQQIPCSCKNRLGTLRLILWWRVTFLILDLSLIK